MLVDQTCAQSPEKTARFNSLDLARLDPTRVPYHIAIIPDGNRRWARRHRSDPQEGHREGADILLDVMSAALDLGVKIVTFYAFSTENWNRSPEEVSALMDLIAFYLMNQRAEMIRKGIQFDTIGDISQLNSFLTTIIQETKEATKDCQHIKLILALNYGSRDEMRRAFQAMLEDYDKGTLTKQAVSEQTIKQYLDTAHLPDPDLLIRTSGEMRISNFLLWQISYAEIYTTPVLWPDFTPQHLLEAILDYQTRDRRWGRT